MLVDPLLEFRNRFPILDNTTYLVSHSLGAMPAATRDALAEYAALRASRGGRAWAQPRGPVQAGSGATTPPRSRPRASAK